MARLVTIVVATCTALAIVAAATEAATAPPTASPDPIQNATLIHAWDWLNFTFETPEAYASYHSNKHYEDCMLAGVKVSLDGDYYVSVPRWKAHVPATVSKVVMRDGLPMLEPYPSWDMNAVGVHGALQSVLGFEIDALNRIWILDQGKVDNEPALPGTIKLVIYDLNTTTHILTHYFSEEVANPVSSFMNDVVVDLSTGFAYITDSGITANSTVTHGGLVVFDFNNNSSRRVLNDDTSVQATDLYLEINGDYVNPTSRLTTGADGIALSHDMQWLHYCPLTSHSFYRIETKLLRDDTMTDAELADKVELMGDRGFSSDGLAMDEQSVLYFTSLEMSGIYAVETAITPLSDTDRVGAPVSNTSSVGRIPDYLSALVRNPELMQWPDTIGWDHKGNLVFVSNQLYHFVSGAMDFDNPPFPNFHIWATYTGTDSYLAGVFPPGDNPTTETFKPLTLALIVGSIFVVVLAFAFGVFFCGNKRVKAARVTRGDHAPRDRPINARPKRGEYAPITGDDDW